MVRRVLADVLVTKIDDHKGESDVFSGMFAKFGYSPVARTPSLWKHATKDICFSLVVDDFGVKHVGKDTVDHLIQALKKLYTISIDWAGSLYCGLTINWDYDKRICDIYMPTYIKEALHKFQHPAPSRPQDAPHAWN